MVNFIIIFIPVAFLIYIFSYIVFLKTTRKKDSTKITNDKFKKKYKHLDYYSDKLPFKNNISATYARLLNLKEIKNECSIIGAYIFKWILNSNVEIIQLETKKFFQTKSEDAIKLKNIISDDSPIMEKELFNLMIEASDENQILSRKNFKKWCKKNFSSLESWLKKYYNKGFLELKKMGCVVEKSKKFIGLINYTDNELSEYGIEMTTEMFGFKNYLEDYSDELETRKAEFIKHCLMYAQIFGIADKVSKQFNEKKIYFSIVTANNLAKDYANLAHQVMVSKLDDSIIFNTLLLNNLSNNN